VELAAPADPQQRDVVRAVGGQDAVDLELEAAREDDVRPR
jgi:hypothetical protein